jgi:CheY-like chemotaxis protein
VRVLVVDDDAEFREELLALLSDRGHAVRSAASAVQATTLLEGEGPSGRREVRRSAPPRSHRRRRASAGPFC